MKPLNFLVVHVFYEQFLLYSVCLKLELYYVDTDTGRYIMKFGAWILGERFGAGNATSPEKGNFLFDEPCFRAF